MTRQGHKAFLATPRSPAFPHTGDRAMRGLFAIATVA